MNRAAQAMLALAPLLTTPALLYVLSGDYVDFGGGEKDIVLALAWLIWSVTFLMCSLLLIYYRWNIRRWVILSALIATTLLVGVGIVASTRGFLGIA